MFEVSTARRDVLRKLAERDWTPTDLAQELGKSRSAVYNHLDELYEQGVLTKRQVPAKTRPATEYSIGDGVVQYLTVMPGQYDERSHDLTPEKRAVLRIWGLPQERYHSVVERYWWRLKTCDAVDVCEDVVAVAVYGSVATGRADDDSDVDVLVVAADAEAEAALTEHFGVRRVEAGEDATLAMTEVFTRASFRQGLAAGSSFLETVRSELHLIYDPEGILQHPERERRNEQ